MDQALTMVDCHVQMKFALYFYDGELLRGSFYRSEFRSLVSGLMW